MATVNSEATPGKGDSKANTALALIAAAAADVSKHDSSGIVTNDNAFGSPAAPRRKRRLRAGSESDPVQDPEAAMTTPVAQSKRAKHISTPSQAGLGQRGISLINLTPTMTPLSQLSTGTPLKSPASLPEKGDPNAVPAELADWVKDGRMVYKGYKYKGAWTDEEDLMLVRIVKRMGAKKWSKIAAELGSGRNSKQCRERWSNQVNPDLKRDKWSPEEDEAIIKAHAELGNCWAKIAQRLPGRTDNMIKNRYNGSLRTRQTKGAGKGAETPRRKQPSRPATKRQSAQTFLQDDDVTGSEAERTAALALGGLSASPAKPKRRRAISTASTFASGGAKRSLSSTAWKAGGNPAPGIPPAHPNGQLGQGPVLLRPTGHTPGKSRSREKFTAYPVLRRRSPQPTTPVPVARAPLASQFSAKPAWQPQFEKAGDAEKAAPITLRSVYHPDLPIPKDWGERFYYFAHPDAVAQCVGSTGSEGEGSGLASNNETGGQDKSQTGANGKHNGESFSMENLLGKGQDGQASKSDINNPNSTEQGVYGGSSFISPTKTTSLDKDLTNTSSTRGSSASPKHRAWHVVKVRFYWNATKQLATLAQPIVGIPLVNAISIPGGDPYQDLPGLHRSLHAAGFVQDCAQKKRLKVYKLSRKYFIPTTEALDMIHGQLSHPKSLSVQVPTTAEVAQYMMDVSRSTPTRRPTTPLRDTPLSTTLAQQQTPKKDTHVAERLEQSNGGVLEPTPLQPTELLARLSDVVEKKSTWPVSNKPCKCKMSKCLKMYCECFTDLAYCGPECKCENCNNLPDNQADWLLAYTKCIERNPLAFDKAETTKKVRCKCRNTQCLKKYCDCYRAGQLCNVSCQCQNCSNSAESALLGLATHGTKPVTLAPVPFKPVKESAHLATNSTKPMTAAPGQLKPVKIAPAPPKSEETIGE